MGEKRIVRKNAGRPQSPAKTNGGQPAKHRDQVSEVRRLLKANEGEILKALGKQLDPDLFLRTCMTYYQRGDDRMFQADPKSFILACVEAAALGLRPDTMMGECYLLAVWDKNVNGYVIDFRLGYKGMMKLARRGTGGLRFWAEVAYANDEFEVCYGTQRSVIHRPWFNVGATEPGEVIAAYAVVEDERGRMQFEVVLRDDIDQRAKKSGDPRNNTPSPAWEWYKAMARKTAIRDLCRWLELGDKEARAMVVDDLREVARDELDRNAIDVDAETQPAPAGLKGLVDKPGGWEAPEDEDQTPEVAPEDEDQTPPEDEDPGR